MPIKVLSTYHFKNKIINRIEKEIRKLLLLLKNVFFLIDMKKHAYINLKKTD